MNNKQVCKLEDNGSVSEPFNGRINISHAGETKAAFLFVTACDSTPIYAFVPPEYDSNTQKLARYRIENGFATSDLIPIDWHYKTADGTLINLSPSEFKYRIRITEPVLLAPELATLRDIVTAKNLPRWEYTAGYTEAYFRVLQAQHIAQLNGLIASKGWTDTDISIEEL